jgi:hypothetical protein
MRQWWAGMSQWHSLNLGDALLAGIELERLERAFDDAYGGAAAQAAVFLRHASEGQLHCDVIVYFTPDAEVLGRRMNARPCAAPAAAGLGLLKGPETAWRLLEADGEGSD